MGRFDAARISDAVPLRRRVLAAAGMSGLVAAACGVGGQPAGTARTLPPAALLFLTAFSEGTPAFDHVSGAVQRFRDRQSAIGVTFANAGWGTAMYEKVQVLMAGGTPADVTIMPAAHGIPIHLQGGFASLEPLAKGDRQFKKTDFFARFIANFTANGQLWGVPVESDVRVLIYNKDLFDRLSVKYPTDTWTWENFLEAATRLTQTLDGQKVFGALAPPWETVVWANGGAFATDPPTEFLLHQPAAADSIQWRADLELKQRVVPTAEDRQGVRPDLFAAGRAAMNWAGSWYKPTMDANARFRWDLAPMPKGKKERAGIEWGDGYLLASGSRHPEQAWELIKHMTSDEIQGYFSDPTWNLMPARIATAKSKSFLRQPPPDNLKAWVDATEYGRTWPLVLKSMDLNRAVGQALTPVWAGTENARQALQAAKPQLDALLKESAAARR